MPTTPGPTSSERRRRRSALAVPNFRTYFISASIAQCGGWLLRTTQAWLVLDLTGSPAALAFVTIAQALPVTILTLFAGILIDRTESRRLLVFVQLIFGAQAALLAALILTHQVQFWHIIVLASLLGVASAVDFPTRSTIVSDLLEPPLVGNGIALNSAMNSAARIVGPGVGGLMLATLGSGFCFAVTACAYLGTTVGLLLLRREEFYPRRLGRRTALFKQLAEGLRYSFSTPSLAVNMILAGFFGTFAYNWALVLPLLARFALNSGAEGFGALNVAMGIGSTIGAFALATRLKPSMRLLLISATAFAAVILVLAHAPDMPTALVMLVCTGMLSVSFNATNNTLLQIEAREDVRGRVLSLYMFLMVGTTPLGSVITGLAASTFDVRVALQINAGLCLVGVTLAWLFLRRSRSTTVTAVDAPIRPG
ncbi:MAG TPA: MFS transporter [Chloroflexota bacterium]|nr:MFS transporter [Chloroflexota bacterium]